MNWKKRTFYITIVLIAATLCACALYPAVWILKETYTQLDHSPDRVFRRVWMITTLAAILCFRKWFAFKPPAEVGYQLNKSGLYNLVLGLITVSCFLAILSLFYVLIGAWDIQQPIRTDKLQKKLIEGFIRGSIVSGLEEYIFRGLIFLSLCSHWNWKKAAVVSSLIFASLHFIQGRQDIVFENPSHFLAGFQLCGILLANMSEEFILFPDAVGLFLVGLILCFSTHKTNSLWYGAGIHGGWIWYFTWRSSIFATNESIPALWIGGHRLYDGIIPIAAMILVFPLIQQLIQSNILAIHPSERRHPNDQPPS